MAIFILGPDPHGTCCECSQRANPCDSCGPIIECEKKGGIAVFYGKQSYTGELLFYLKETASGSVQCCNYSLNSCPDPGHYNPFVSKRSQFSGFQRFDSTSDTPTSGSFYTSLYFCLECGEEGVFESTYGTIFNLCNGYSFVLTSTTKTTLYPNGCYPFNNIQVIGELKYTLSELFTTEDAISTLMNDTNWVSGSCSSIYQIPTTKAFSYQKSRWRINKTGYLPNTAYDVTVKYYRYLYPYSEESLFQTVTVEVTTGSDGSLVSSYYEVPNAEGYITRVDNEDVVINIS